MKVKLSNTNISIALGLVAVGVFTVAVNTGPLQDSVLLDAGANLLYPSMQALCDGWEELYSFFRKNLHH
jgi:hypothetical protein